VEVLPHHRSFPEFQSLDRTPLRVPIVRSAAGYRVAGDGGIGRVNDIFRPEMSTVAEFAEVGIEGHAMRGEEVELVGEGIELFFDAIKFVVQIWISLSQATLAGFVVGMKFTNCLELVRPVRSAQPHSRRMGGDVRVHRCHGCKCRNPPEDEAPSSIVHAPLVSEQCVPFCHWDEGTGGSAFRCGESFGGLRWKLR
jgi:hypothetical protein